MLKPGTRKFFTTFLGFQQRMIWFCLFLTCLMVAALPAQASFRRHSFRRAFVYENVAFYGQCPKPVRDFYHQNYSWLPSIPRLTSGNHGAYLFWNVHVPSGFERVAYQPEGELPQKDDMLILGRSSRNRYGHVAVVVDATSEDVTVVDSNWVGGRRLSGGIHTIAFDERFPVLGWYHPLPPGGEIDPLTEEEPCPPYERDYDKDRFTAPQREADPSPAVSSPLTDFRVAHLDRSAPRNRSVADLVGKHAPSLPVKNSSVADTAIVFSEDQPKDQVARPVESPIRNKAWIDPRKTPHSISAPSPRPRRIIYYSHLRRPA